MAYIAYFQFQMSQTETLYSTVYKSIPNDRDLDKPNFRYSAFSKKFDVLGEIHEDWTYEVKTNFVSYAEAMGGISNIASNLQNMINNFRQASTLASGMTNQASGMYNKLMVWKDTEPLQMTFNIFFETKTDPFFDVLVPTNLLVSRTMLTPTNASDAIVPGIYGGVFKSSTTADRNGNIVATSEAQNPTGGTEASFSYLLGYAESKGKVISSCGVAYRNLNLTGNTGNRVGLDSAVRAVGYDYNSLVNFSPAFISSVKPTFSKDRTTSGVPIYAKVEVQIQSILSASDNSISSAGATQIDPSMIGSAAVNIFR